MGSPDRSAGYDPFAWIYSRDWGGEYHSQAVGVLNRALLDQLPPPAHILDLCCGDGRLAQCLLEAGYRVTGLDISAEMLGYARERCPAASFLQADARSFALAPRFDAVLSTFDSLNHIMSASDLRRVFRNVKTCLKPHGWLLFDLNRECAYTELWVWPYTKVEADRAFIARGTYDRDRRVASCDITVFRQQEDAWQRSDFNLKQHYHTDAEVRMALDREGFQDTVAFDAQDDLGMRGGIGYGRVYYRARLA